MSYGLISPILYPFSCRIIWSAHESQYCENNTWFWNHGLCGKPVSHIDCIQVGRDLSHTPARKDPGLMVDPLPQALVLTSIVIELGTTALLVALAVNIHKHYGTLNVRKVRRLKG